jgi:ureidoacrylate peracid hydrolase
MHPLNMPESLVERVTRRNGRRHAYARLDPRRTALLAVDMQNYFVAPGAPASCAAAPKIAPNINRLAAALRADGGRVVWIVTEALPRDAADWENLYELLGPAGGEKRYDGLERESEGYAMWPAMDVRAEDWRSVKLRYSAFIQGSSDLGARLKDAGIDTVLVTGVATNVCCESTARDAMMLGFRTVMVHDGLGTTSDEEHNATLATFYNLFGDVQSTDEAIAHLRAG